MKLTVALLLAGCAVAAATDVAMWDACGGRSSFGQNASDPSVACPAGSYCNFFNEWFWQCQPDGTATAMPDTETVTYPTDCANRVPLWGSCGGISSGAGANAPDAAVCCPSGTVCRFYNEYFWQCQPINYAAPPEAVDVWSTGCNGEKVPTWGACGGSEHGADNSSNAAVCCPQDRVCNYYSTAFWQCQPVGYVGPTEEAAAGVPSGPASAKSIAFTLFSSDACDALDSSSMTTLLIQIASAALGDSGLPVVMFGECTAIAGRRLNMVVASTIAVTMELNLVEMDETEAAALCDTVGAAIEADFTAAVAARLGSDVTVEDLACVSESDVVVPAEPVALQFTLSFAEGCDEVSPLSGAITSMILNTIQTVLGANGYATVDPFTCEAARRRLLAGSSADITSIINFSGDVDADFASQLVALITVALQTDLLSALATIGLTATISAIGTMPADELAPAGPSPA